MSYHTCNLVGASKSHPAWSLTNQLGSFRDASDTLYIISLCVRKTSTYPWFYFRDNIEQSEILYMELSLSLFINDIPGFYYLFSFLLTFLLNMLLSKLPVEISYLSDSDFQIKTWLICRQSTLTTFHLYYHTSILWFGGIIPKTSYWQ